MGWQRNIFVHNLTNSGTVGTKIPVSLSTRGSIMGASRSFYVPALTPRGLFRFAMFIFFILFCRQYLEDYFANRLTTQYSFSLLSDVMSAGEVKISLSICVPYGMSRTMEVTDIDEKLKVLE